MICPKCNEGDISKVMFKSTKEIAYLCNLCEALWFKGEVININSGHTLQSFSRGEELEYIVEPPLEVNSMR